MRRTAWIILTLGCRLSAFAAIAVSLVGGRGLVVAQDARPTMQVEVGFDGYCRSDAWCPVYTVISNEGTDVEGELRIVVGSVSGGDEPNMYVRPVVLPAHSRKAYFLYVPSAGASSRFRLTVQLLSAGKVLSSAGVTVRRLDEQDRLYGVASGNPSALNFLSDVAPTGGRAMVARLDLASLPPDPLAWEALDVLILNDVDTTALSGERRQALETWVAHGGHLIVGGGAGTDRTAAGVAGLLPVATGGVRAVDDLSGLGERFSAPVVAASYPVVQATLRDGEVLIEQQGQRDEEGDLILMARRSYGTGTVDFLAFDAGLRPFIDWDDNLRLWEFIAGAEGVRALQPAVYNGYTAREAINAIPGLDLPSTLQLLAFMLVYTLLVGPVNYLVLRKLDRRELAWLTIPVLVLGFTVCAYATGFQIRGGIAIVHRLAAVYVPGDTRVGRVSQVVGLFSPRRTDYDVWAAGAAVCEPPGDSYGGPARQPLRVVGGTEGSTIVDLRVDVGGIQPFVAEGYADVSPVEADLRLVVNAAGNLQLEGTVRNGAVPLKDAVLILGTDEQRLGDLGAGEEVSVRLLPSSKSGVVMPSPYSSGPPGYDIPEQILGPGDYWQDRELYRRYQFVQALFPYEGPGLAAGVYLLGWTGEGVPMPVEVVDRPFSAVEMALYIYDLPVAGLEVGATIIVPPALLTRRVERTTGYAEVWPGGCHLEPGAEVVFGFTVWPDVKMSQVDELVLNMDRSSRSSGSLAPVVSLWSQESGDWEQVNVGWGEHSIPQAGAYVVLPGEVLVRLEAGEEWPADVENFTLTIKGRR